MVRQAKCHPDRPLRCREMCASCYRKWLRETNPEYRARSIEHGKEWARKNRERHRANNKRWRQENQEYLREYRRKNRHQQRKSWIKLNYGLSWNEYEAMFDAQDGKCAICGSPNPGRGAHWFDVDHDHRSGRVRGLLCHSCNVGLGAFKDDLEIVRRAVQYMLTLSVAEEGTADADVSNNAA